MKNHAFHVGRHIGMHVARKIHVQALDVFMPFLHSEDIYQESLHKDACNTGI